MKIKDLIKHLETLDQEKELVIIATDPTGWDYGMVVGENSINESVIYPSEENGLIDYFKAFINSQHVKDEDDMDEDEYDENDEDEDDDDDDGIECYVIRIDC